MFYVFRKKQVLNELKIKPSDGSVVTSAEDQKAYGSESATKAVLSYGTNEQRVQTEQVILSLIALGGMLNDR